MEHPLHGLDVVVQHVRVGVQDRSERVVAAQVGDQHLHLARGLRVVDRADTGGEHRRAAVVEVVAGYGRDDAVLQPQLVHGLR